MEFYIYDESRQLINVIDYFTSAIWTPRYYDVGDFELQISASKEVFALMKEDYYIARLDDDMVGIIEHSKLMTDEENGDFLLITGRDAKSILGRRIVWTQTNLSGTVEDCIRQLITENVISPTDSNRAIPNFILGEHKGFTETMKMQVTGDNLLEIVTKICQIYGYGFSVTLVDGTFVFNLYKGTDRSLDQVINPHVEFSPDLDNVITVEYEVDCTDIKNVALIAGEGEGTDRKTVSIGTTSGMARRELYVDARDMSTNGGEIDDNTYLEMLAGRGDEKLAEYYGIAIFAGQVEPAVNYEYKKDYFLGDKIQITNEYGVTASTRIIEIIECEDANGYSMTPTFEEV